ncbi:NAD-dependent epimerase/dehydratase family protein [Chitinophaga oryzae]|uniref:NAD-dependent epimerase/dehydratase family protein n=1 Tax=Chitinophaga oryzae TaxID=2725414 RepID=A0AAE6ZJ22_9BACT|nr:NAD-dependent epimerase/dehydratase family protein [Chitinophaga oryzae]QJB34104.1 NAD-dependent epimerase/dehydratase family protein [Chitinophaga oryzae]QJB40623.1 NAD-dependent epimerase/dehydratase family protein [Chitinophaga oryzae]
METILILGGYGFLGSNVIDYAGRYLGGQYNFIVFDFYINHPLQAQFSNVIKTYKGDFTNQEDVRVIFEENKIDYIFHFISTTVPSTSNNNIIYDIESNLVPTIHLLDLAHQYDIKNVVYISSGGAIYGAASKYVHKEEDPLHPISSYGIVKMSIEKYLKLYNHLHGINYLALRLSNPYGAYHLSEKQGLINVALKKALKQEQFEVWGDGTNIKDYIYAEDFAKIIFRLLEKKVENKVINVGSGKGYSINELLEIVKGLVPSFQIKYQDVKSFDVPKVILDTSEMAGFIDFELLDIESGINKTYKWIQEQQPD